MCWATVPGRSMRRACAACRMLCSCRVSVARCSVATGFRAACCMLHLACDAFHLLLRHIVHAVHMLYIPCHNKDDAT